ncbi:BrnA antitoxin family protein [Acidithiobacillus ferrivorans]|nr:BrnA antitoxin family protein [Acidithiobacillus ferrivorans]
MRKEYDLERLTVKRRGQLPGLSGIPEAPETDVVDDKVQVTLTLDRDVTAFFEAQAQRSSARTFTTAVNQALRQYIATATLPG